MNVQILVTITGAYQADLLNALSEKTHALGGIWLTSKISHVEGYMTGLFKVELMQENVEVLLDSFKELPIKVDWVKLQYLPEMETKYFNLLVDAKDRTGLINDISTVLSENDVKVESMECHRIGLPDIGGTVFTSNFQIAVSDAFNRELLIASLQEISNDLIVDIKEV